MASDTGEPVGLGIDAPEMRAAPQPFYELAGEVAVVTGAAGDGIGRATAQRLARDGATVAVTDIHAGRTERTVSELRARYGDRVHGYVLDIGDPQTCRSVLAQVAADLGPVGILVNNAAINVATPLLGDDDGEWERVVDVGLHSIRRLCMLVLHGMVERRRGNIVNITSVGAWIGGGYSGGYAPAKAAVHSLTCAIASEFGPMGVRCNAVAPGIINSRWVNSRAEHYAPEAARTPLRRFGEPEEVADAVAFLVSDASSFITGEILNVSGGWFMRP